MASKIRYTVSCLEGRTHHIGVEIRVPVRGGGPVRFAMPVWSPGSYSVDEFAGRVHGVEFSDAPGKPLRFSKADKTTWSVSPGSSRAVIARNKLFALDVDVHRSYLDDTRCTINGPSVYMYVEGRKQEPVEVTFRVPPGWKRIDTGLTRTRHARSFAAADYDELADCPVFLGNHVVEAFEVRGVTHTLAIVGSGNHDLPDLKADTRRIVEQRIKLFGEIPAAQERHRAGKGGLPGLDRGGLGQAGPP